MSKFIVVLATAVVIVCVSAFATATSLRSDNLQQQQRAARFRSALASPSELWQWNTASGKIFSNPVSTATQVFVGLHDSTLVNLNARNGVLNWTAGKSTSSGKAVMGGAVITADSVYWGNNAGELHKVSRLTGAADPSFNQWNATGYPIVGTPVVYEPKGLIIFGGFDAKIYAVDRSTGRLVWNASTESFVTASPSIAKTSQYGDVVVAPSQDGYVYLFDASSGVRKNLISAVGNQPIQHGCAISGGVIAICGAKQGKLFAWNLDKDLKLWEHQFNGSPTAAPALSLDGKSVIVPAGFDKVFKVSVASGSVEWSYHYSNYLNTGAIVGKDSNGEETVFIGTNDDTTTLLALAASSGALKWTFTGKFGTITGTPSQQGSDVYVATTTGSVVCIKS